MNKHTATHNGQTFTRNSATRIYSHCVAVRPSLDAARRQVEKDLLNSNHLSNYDFNKTSRNAITDYKDVVVPEQLEEQIQFNRDFPTFDSYLVSIRAKLEKRLQKQIDDGDFESFFVVGWNSRPDLARKLADQNISRGDCAEVVILEAKVS